MLTTEDLSIVLSSEYDIDMQSIDDCVGISCNNLIGSSMKYIRNKTNNGNSKDFIKLLYNKQNGYFVSIFPFSMIFLDMFS